MIGSALLTAHTASATEPAAPAQVVAAWGFEDVDAGGTAPDVIDGAPALQLSGSWSIAQGSNGAPAAAFTAQSFGTTTLAGPGTAEFAVTVVLRNLKPQPFKDSPNVVQVGLYNDPGQIKMQLAKSSKGQAQCRFKGDRSAILLTGPTINVTDGAWHSVTCWRQGAMVGVTVDGATTSKAIDVGSIMPTRPMTVAGRGLTSGDLSDQFIGDIDAVVWATGDGSRDIAPTYANQLLVPSGAGS
jgi:hypothetical protein